MSMVDNNEGTLTFIKYLAQTICIKIFKRILKKGVLFHTKH